MDEKEPRSLSRLGVAAKALELAMLAWRPLDEEK